MGKLPEQQLLVARKRSHYADVTQTLPFFWLLPGLCPLLWGSSKTKHSSGTTQTWSDASKSQKRDAGWKVTDPNPLAAPAKPGWEEEKEKE